MKIKNNTWLYAILIIVSFQFAGATFSTGASSGLYAQTDETPSQKNLKKEKKKRMKASVRAEGASKKRHMDIQTKETRKRMKKHLKITKKNVKNMHR